MTIHFSRQIFTSFVDESKDIPQEQQNTTIEEHFEREELFAFQIKTVVGLGWTFVDKIQFGRRSHVFPLFHLLDQMSQAIISMLDFVNVEGRQVLMEHTDLLLTRGSHYFYTISTKEEELIERTEDSLKKSLFSLLLVLKQLSNQPLASPPSKPNFSEKFAEITII